MSSSDPGRGVTSQVWFLRSRELLQRSADELDGATRSRLGRARQAALAQLEPRVGAPRWLNRLGFASVVLGAGLIVWRGLVPVLTPSPTADVAPASTPVAVAPAPVPVVLDAEAALVSEPDFEMLADADSLFLLDELEFYAWLDQDEDGDG